MAPSACPFPSLHPQDSFLRPCLVLCETLNHTNTTVPTTPWFERLRAGKHINVCHMLALPQHYHPVKNDPCNDLDSLPGQRLSNSLTATSNPFPLKRLHLASQRPGGARTGASRRIRGERDARSRIGGYRQGCRYGGVDRGRGRGRGSGNWGGGCCGSRRHRGRLQRCGLGRHQRNRRQAFAHLTIGRFHPSGDECIERDLFHGAGFGEGVAYDGASTQGPNGFDHPLQDARARTVFPHHTGQSAG